VWVQRFKDRPTLVLRRLDLDTGTHESKTAGTPDDKDAEQARADLEFELNHGNYQEALRVSWERFRDIKTTMDYYGNTEQAVEEAVLGHTCNGLRNTDAQMAAPDAARADGNPSTSSPNQPSAN